MSVSPAWAGEIDAKKPEGSNTGLALKKGQKITIGASGWVKRGKEDYTLAGPQGVAGKNDGVAVLKGRIGGVEFIVGNYLIDFEAPADGELSLYVADGLTKYADNSGSFKAEVFLPAGNNGSGSGFEDLTNFIGNDWNDWNDWKTGDATTRATLENSQCPCRVLQLMTYPGEKNAGTVVHKTLSGLQSGKEYHFSIVTKRIIGLYKEPRLSLEADGATIVPVTNLKEKDVWVTLTGKFVAKSDKAELKVISHESDSNGNDYQISQLKITG